MLRCVRCLLCKHVPNARDLVAPVAAEALARVVRSAAACRRVTRKARRRPVCPRLVAVQGGGRSLCVIVEVACRGTHWARIHVGFAWPIVERAAAIKLRQVGNHPRTRPIVRGIVVAACRPSKRRVALGAIAAAGRAAIVLYRQHLRARLHADTRYGGGLGWLNVRQA